MLTDQSSMCDVARANETLRRFYERFRHKAYPLFGDGLFLRAAGDTSAVAAATISHRFLKKFREPTESNVRDLTKACMDSWIEYEEVLKSHNFYACPAQARGVVYRARELIHKWCADFKVDLTEVDLEFTPGESFTSQHGYVSVYQKLRRKDCWTVTHDAAEDFIRLVYNTLSLKRCAKLHMEPRTRAWHRSAVARHSHAAHVGYSVFRERMLNEVLTIVYGSRASSVEKNADERRFINVEPLGNMLLQRCVASPVRAILSSVGNDLTIGQELHKLLIQDPNSATVDFSKASDSILLHMVELLFPTRVFKYLNRYRSPMVLVGDDYYIAAKISSMGNGFTFEIMTMILLALARSLDPASSVYGDDVILHNEVAIQFIDAAKAVGFRVNTTKTFIDSPVRESCGAFWCDGFGYIECFDIKWCQNDIDVITTVNKFYMMGLQTSDCKQLLIEAYEALLLCVPPCYMGPPRKSLTSDYAFCEDYRRKHMRTREHRQLFSDVLLPLSSYIRSTYGYIPEDLALVRVPKVSLADGSKRSKHLQDSGFKYASYLYAGRIAQDSVRGTDTISSNLHIVTPSGLLLSVKVVTDELFSSYALWTLLVYLSLGFKATCTSDRRPRCYLVRPDFVGPTKRVT